MNPAYISALSALAGALIGGLTSFATSWLTQRAQIINARREGEKAKLEALYSDFIAEATRVMGDALTHQTDDLTALMQLYALVGRMRLVSERTVINAACGSRKLSWRATSGQTAPLAKCWNIPIRAARAS